MPQRPTVLLIDDDRMVHDVVALHLAGFAELIHSEDPHEGLDLAETEDPDVILLDIEMPQINGLDVCRTIKRRHSTSHIVVLFLTADGDPTNAIRALDTGALDYITKPIEPNVLRERITQALRTKQMCELWIRRALMLTNE